MSWYGDPAFHYRKPIVIDNTKVSGDLVDFPVLVWVTDTRLRDKCQAAGEDVLFTADDETTKLDHEIEKYDNTTGELIAWVKVPALAGAVDTTIFLYFGNTVCADQQNPTGVWDADFKAVYHLNDDFNDSTVNANHATDEGTDDIEAKIADGQYYDGDAEYIQFPTQTAFGRDDDATIEFFFKLSAGSDGYYIYDMEYYTDKYYYDNLFAKKVGVDESGHFHWWTYVVSGGARDDLTVSDSSKDWRDDAFHHVTAKIQGGVNMTLDLWIDGVHIGQDTTVGVSFDWNAADTLGNVTGRARNYWYNEGLQSYSNIEMDETRFHSSARSTNWIETNFNTQNDPATFFTEGAEETNLTPITADRSIPITLRGGIRVGRSVKVDLREGIIQDTGAFPIWSFFNPTASRSIPMTLRQHHDEDRSVRVNLQTSMSQDHSMPIYFLEGILNDHALVADFSGDFDVRRSVRVNTLQEIFDSVPYDVVYTYADLRTSKGFLNAGAAEKGLEDSEASIMLHRTAGANRAIPLPILEGIEQDESIPIDWRSEGIFGSRVMPIWLNESLAIDRSVRVNTIQPITLARSIPAYFLERIEQDESINISYKGPVTTDRSIPVMFREYIIDSEAMPINFIERIEQDASIPMGWSGPITSTITIPVKFLEEIAGDEAVNMSFSQALAEAITMPLRTTQGIENDQAVVIHTKGSPVADRAMAITLRQALAEVQAVPISIGAETGPSPIYADRPCPIWITADVSEDVKISVTISQKVQADRSMPVSWFDEIAEAVKIGLYKLINRTYVYSMKRASKGRMDKHTGDKVKVK